MSPELEERINKICGALERTTDMLREETDVMIVNGDHVELIRHFDKARQAQERIKEARKVLEAIIDKMSSQDVPEAMRAAGVKTTTVEGVGRVTVSHRFGCTMVDKVAGMDWLRKNGHGDIIQETVNASTLAAFAKTVEADTGVDLPAELFKTSSHPYTSITKK